MYVRIFLKKAQGKDEDVSNHKKTCHDWVKMEMKKERRLQTVYVSFCCRNENSSSRAERRRAATVCAFTPTFTALMLLLQALPERAVKVNSVQTAAEERL